MSVGTDDFLRIRKNREPILPYEQRIDIIKSIRYVDQVVPEVDLDKIGAFYKYNFDVMIVGDDHKTEPIYIEAVKELKKMGIDTIYIPHRINISSTMIRNKINAD